MQKLITLTVALNFPLLAFGQCVPVANWSGKLILPESQSRSADGGVGFLVENSPEAFKHLKGKKLHLRFGLPGSNDRDFSNSKRIDVNIGEKGRRAIEVEKNQLPVRLDGWKNVSPLESLAASRDNDVIRVEIPDADIQIGNEITFITTKTEPLLLDGTSQCLLQFVEVSDDKALVRFFDKNSKKFSENVSSINLDFKKNLYYPSSVPTKTLAGIESHETNKAGWNGYGSFQDGVFTLEAIESYSMLKLKVTSEDDSITKKFKNRLEYWTVKENDKTRARQIIYSGKDNKSAADSYKIGDKFLLTHAFGSYNDHGTVMGYTRGHASMGTAEIVAHPITGEAVYKLIYKQTFGHWPQGTFAASFHYHAYSGNLYRGWMYHLPITDVLYPLPAGSEEFYHAFDRAFDSMAADYRSGFGSGYARITLMASCVHDTGNTIIGVLDQFLTKSKGITRSDSNPELKKLLTIMKRNLGNQVLPDQKFRQPDTLPDDIDSKPSTLFAGRKNMTITVPRNFQDEVLKAYVKDGSAPVVVLQTVQAGDDMDGVIPRKPNRINTFTGALLGVLLRGAIGNWIEF